jgi:arsenate reductase
MLKFYGYKKCGTARKGEKFLNDHEIEYEFIDITINPPSKAELTKIIKQSGKPVKKFFNTSGVVYKEQGLKDKLKTMSEGEMIDLLASEGKVIKRPLVTDGKKSTVAFKEEEFQETWGE